VLATLATTRTSHVAAHGASTAAALTDGYHLAFTIATVLVLAAIALGLAFLRPDQALHSAAEAAPDELDQDLVLEEAA
jgi:hypothetical protein